jgi:hypothetical protein
MDSPPLLTQLLFLELWKIYENFFWVIGDAFSSAIIWRIFWEFREKNMDFPFGFV